jgi:hypothetical protein
VHRFQSWALSLLAALFALTLLSGCGSCRTRGYDPIEFNGGATEGNTYITSGVSDEYLHFPPGRTYDLMHELGTTPSSVHSWVSFRRVIDQGETERGSSGNYAESAGNQVVVECQDEQRVRVRNDTCADFYLRVEARADSSTEPLPCR